MSMTDPRQAGRVTAAERKAVEYIDVFTPAGKFVIDLTATFKDGYIDEDGVETTGDALLAVQTCIKQAHHLLKPDGFPILISNLPMPTAYGYRREEKRS